MVTRILLGECKQEVSSFNPVLSHYDAARNDIALISQCRSPDRSAGEY